jgi:hypothetical protein
LWEEDSPRPNEAQPARLLRDRVFPGNENNSRLCLLKAFPNGKMRDEDHRPKITFHPSPFTLRTSSLELPFYSQRAAFFAK